MRVLVSADHFERLQLALLALPMATPEQQPAALEIIVAAATELVASGYYHDGIIDARDKHV